MGIVHAAVVVHLFFANHIAACIHPGFAANHVAGIGIIVLRAIALFGAFADATQTGAVTQTARDVGAIAGRDDTALPVAQWANAPAIAIIAHCRAIATGARAIAQALCGAAGMLGHYHEAAGQVFSPRLGVLVLLHRRLWRIALLILIVVMIVFAVIIAT